jgi:hypothetical protein
VTVPGRRCAPTRCGVGVQISQEASLMKTPICSIMSAVLALSIILTGCSDLSTVKSQSASDSAATLAKYQDALA